MSLSKQTNETDESFAVTATSTELEEIVMNTNSSLVHSRNHNGTALFIVFLASIAVYYQGVLFNSFRNGFHMDDVVAIQKNFDVINPDWTDWSSFIRHDFWGLDMFSGEWTHKSFRPVTTLSYRINWLISGLDTSSFHISNILLHAAVSALIVLFCIECLGWSSADAFVLGILFAYHPVHTESVLYLVGRADILCAFFMLCGIIVYPRNVIVSYCLIILAGLSKELGLMTFPLLIILDGIKVLESRSKRNDGIRLFKTFIVCVGSLVLRHWYTDGTYLKMSPQDNPVAFEDDDLGRRISYTIIHGEYARLLVYPNFLCYDYSLNTIPVACWIDDLRLLSPLASYLAFFSLTFVALQQRSRTLIIGTSLFLFSFIPMSNVLFPVGTVVGERLLYIPSIGFLIVFSVMIPEKARRPVLLCLAVAYGVRTVLRVDDWKSSNNLTRVDGAVNPKSSKTLYNLGVQYFTKQRYDEAVDAFRRSFESDELRRDGVAYWRAGQAELLRGNIHNAERLLVAATHKYGAKLMVREEEIFHDAGVALYQTQKIEEARYHLSAALQLNRRFPKALNNMGCLLVAHGDPSTGLNLIQEASKLKPRNVIYSGNVWIVASTFGLSTLAESAKNQTLFIQRSFVPAKYCVWEFKPAEGGPTDSAMND